MTALGLDRAPVWPPHCNSPGGVSRQGRGRRHGHTRARRPYPPWRHL